MYPRDFEYAAPASVAEAVELLAANPGTARVLAGGASLIPMLKLRLASPELLVDIGRIPGLDAVEERDGHVVIGPMVTHATAARHPLLAQHATALAEAAAMVGDVQVRNQGTLAGSLAHADSVADEPGPALALAATIVARSVRGDREIPAAEFFVGPLTSALVDDEMVVEVRVPKAGPGEASAYDKLGRRGMRSDYPVAGAAAWVRREGGEVVGARIAVTGAGTKATLVAGAGSRLVAGQSAAAAAEGAATELTVLADLYGAADYKAHLVGVYVQRAVEAALARTLDS